MAYESDFQLSDDLLLTGVEQFEKFYSQFTGMECDLAQLAEKIKNNETDIYYFDNKCKRVTKKDAKYAWIDLKCNNSNGKPVFLCLMKHFGVFEGHFVAEGSYLILRNSDFEANKEEFQLNGFNFLRKYKDNCLDELPVSENTSNESVQVRDAGDIAEQLKELLLLNNWESPNGLRRYLLILSNQIKYYVNNKMTDYYVVNNIKSVVINIGLLNRFGGYLHVMYRYHVTDNCYYPFKIILSKTTYTEHGFTMEDAAKELKPISLLDNRFASFSTNPKLYDASYQSLSHCVDSRRERFPENIAEISDFELARKISQELDTGLSIHRCGGSYAKAIYKAKEDELHWVLPLHVNVDINQTPELVMVISKRKDFYDIRTILPYDEEVRDSIRAVTPYANLW